MKKTSEKEVYLTIQALQRMPYYLHCLEKAEELLLVLLITD